MTNFACATSRGAADRRSPVAALAVALLLAAAPGYAAVAAAPSGFELTHSVEQTLVHVQELWLQWVSATLQDNLGKADEALRGLQGAAHEVGFRHLPDLALGAIAQARQSAKNGDFERAHRQLEAAEQLDPGRPEAAFAEAAVARREGDWSRWILALGSGFGRVWDGPERLHVMTSVLLWLLLVLTLASALFVVLLAATHGRELFDSLHAAFSGHGWSWVVWVLCALFLVAPLALPSGIYLALLIWSALLWSYASRSERVLLVLGWLLIAVGPMVVDRAQRRLALEESPPMRAVRAFADGRLYGTIFSDLQVLRTAVPDKPVITELTADVHRTLGQWDLARGLYRRILIDEPDNVAVLINLGAYHFRKGEFALANGYFQRATRGNKPSAAAWYNLSLGFSEAYTFDDSRDALARARAIDGSAVDGWMATSNPDRVLTFNGSLARTGEIRDALRAAWVRHGDGTLPTPSARWTPVALSAIVGLVALGFDVWRRSLPSIRPAGRSHTEERPAGRWAHALLPAVNAAGRGAGWAAWGNLLLLVSLLFLPRLFELAGDLAVMGWPGPTLLASLAAIGGLVYLGFAARSALGFADRD